MSNELNALMKKYGITQPLLAVETDCSQALVSLVLRGKKPDRREIIPTAIKLIEAAQREERRAKRKLSDLIAAADLLPAA